MGDKVKKILEKVGTKAPSTRTPVTLSLNSYYYSELQDIAERSGAKVSRIIDELVMQFVDEAKATKSSKK